jgi:hypothetical protein
MPKEYVIYYLGQGENYERNSEMFEGTTEQIKQLVEQLPENYRSLAGEEITIVYRGPSIRAAKKVFDSIKSEPVAQDNSPKTI